MSQRYLARPGLTWVQFSDAHSGGGLAESPFEDIYIEAENEDAAVRIFRNRFGHSPYAVACDCCGSNYSITDGFTDLRQASGYERGCEYAHRNERGGRYLELGEPTPDGWTRMPSWRSMNYEHIEEYLTRTNVLVLWDRDIDPDHKEE
jgi:hypothetical protein